MLANLFSLMMRFEDGKMKRDWKKPNDYDRCFFLSKFHMRESKFLVLWKLWRLFKVEIKNEVEDILFVDSYF